MPLDPRIALGFQSPQFESPLNMMAGLTQMTANANQSKLAQAKLAAQMEDAAALKSVNSLAATPGFDINNPATLQKLNASEPGRKFVADYFTGAKNRIDFNKADEELVKAELEGRRGALLALGSPTDPDAAKKLVGWRQGTRGNQHLQAWMDSHGIQQPSDEEFAARIATPEGLANEWNGAVAALNQLTGKGEAKVEHLSTGDDMGEILTDTNPNSRTFGQTLAKFKSKPVGGGNTFNLGDRSDLEATKLGAKALYDTREKLGNAPDYWQSLENARELIPKQKNKKGEEGKAFMGTGAEPWLEAIKFLNNRFGTNINPKGITDTDSLRSLMFNGVLENLKKLDSQPAQSQQFALNQALGNIGSDPNALVRIIDWTQQQLENRVNRYNDEATQASGKIKFLYDMPIKMPTRQSAPSGPPAVPEGYKPVPKK
jgi:hypothetical protein